MASAPDIKAVSEELNKAVADYTTNASSGGSDIDKSQRRRIVDAANRLIASVRDPDDEWVDSTVQTAVITANRLFWEWKVFEHIPSEPGSDISYAELAEKTGVEEALLGIYPISRPSCPRNMTDLP
jgi:hypothetical protein